MSIEKEKSIVLLVGVRLDKDHIIILYSYYFDKDHRPHP